MYQVINTIRSIRDAAHRCNYLSGMNVTKDGDEVLQTSWGEFDSHRLQIIAFVPQLVQEEPCKFSDVSSSLTEGYNNGLITQWAEYAPFKRSAVGSNPTGVISRLIVQRKEHLASNEKVLGSNPSKAANPSLAQGIEHGATNAGCRRFDSCMRVHFRWRNWQRKFLTRTRLNVQVVHGRKFDCDKGANRRINEMKSAKNCDKGANQRISEMKSAKNCDKGANQRISEMKSAKNCDGGANQRISEMKSDEESHGMKREHARRIATEEQFGAHI